MVRVSGSFLVLSFSARQCSRPQVLTLNIHTISKRHWETFLYVTSAHKVAWVDQRTPRLIPSTRFSSREVPSHYCSGRLVLVLILFGTASGHACVVWPVDRPVARPVARYSYVPQTLACDAHGVPFGKDLFDYVIRSRTFRRDPS
jgi:hypothetical protein